MVVRRWVDNVEYHEYAPTEVRYDPEQDAFTVAGADIHTPIPLIAAITPPWLSWST